MFVQLSLQQFLDNEQYGLSNFFILLLKPLSGNKNFSVGLDEEDRLL